MSHTRPPSPQDRALLSSNQAHTLSRHGIVLLELGFWQPLHSFQSVQGDDEDPHQFRDRLVALTRQELRGQAGRIYADAVRECLTNSGDATDVRAPEVMCWKDAAALNRCVALGGYLASLLASPVLWHPSMDGRMLYSNALASIIAIPHQVF